MGTIRDRAGWVVAAVVSLTALAAVAGIARGGPLDPTGSPAPTMKTLDQVEPRTPISSLPYTISQPGSYYVTGNLTGVSGQNGITIAASPVSLDLGGFQLKGVPGSLDGITAVTVGAVVRIENGIVRSWGDDGLDLSVTAGSDIHDVSAGDNAQTGIEIGSRSTLSRCIVSENNYGVIANGSDNTVRECSATLNIVGFEADANSNLFEHNIGSANNEAMATFSSSKYTIVRENVFNDNVWGILMPLGGNDNCIVENNIARNNSNGNYNIATASCDVGPITSAAAKTSPAGNIQ